MRFRPLVLVEGQQGGMEEIDVEVNADCER